MSHKYKKISYLALCGLLALASCTKKLNTNTTDPNGLDYAQITAPQVFAQALLSTVQNKIGINISTATDNYDFATNWMGYLARNAGWAASGSQLQVETFTLSNSFADGVWQSLYHNIYDYDYVVAKSTTSGSILPGASRVMRDMVYQDLVDQFGNIPYTQAAQDTAILNPAYDSATAIYPALIIDLDTAINEIAASSSTSDNTSDVMFGGNKTYWLEFANTIKLRILLRQIPNTSNASYVQAQINAIVTQGYGFMGPGKDATIQPGFKDAVTQQSPFWADYGFQPGWVAGGNNTPYQNYNFFCANNEMLNFLDSTGDPRMALFYDTTVDGGYAGEPLGNDGVNSVTSPIGYGVLQVPTTPAILFSAAQSLFMQSEAAYRGLLPGNYQTFFKEGVEESFRYLTSTTAAADAFIASSTNGMVNLTYSTNILQTIMTQKWVAECEEDGLEAWSDFRRTGYPIILVPSQAALGQAIPVRLLYPETEYTQNPKNVEAQNQLATDIYTPIFWAQ